MSDENKQPEEDVSGGQPEPNEQPASETPNEEKKSMFDGMEAGAGEPEEPTAEEGVRPEGLEDKFWDEENKKVKFDQVLESYKHLRKKVGEKFEVPEAYDLGDTGIQFPSETIDAFKEAGLTQKQAQAVAGELSARLLAQVKQRESAAEISALRNHWGSASDEGFQRRMQSVFDFAVEKTGSQELAKELTTNMDQVLAWEARLQAEMRNGRVEVRQPAYASDLTLPKLEQRMSDPRNNPNSPSYDHAFRAETDRQWDAYEQAELRRG